MTGSRKKTWLGIMWGGLFLLFAGACVFLYSAMKGHAEARARLVNEKAQLEALYRMAPFPSRENVELERQNLEVLRGALDTLQDVLGRRQVEPTELRQPTVFMDSFWQTRRDLVNQARTAGVSVPTDFAFGFDAYLKGTPPRPDHVPRLMQQLTVIRRLCDVLLQARVNAIDAIGREVFESDPADGLPASGTPAFGSPGPRRPRGSAAVEEEAQVVNLVNPNAGLMETGDLFSKLRFVILFKAREESVLQVLNALASNEMFVVIENVNWQAPTDQVVVRRRVFGPAGGGLEASPPADGQPKESRVVSGREAVLTVRLDLDVYRFARKAE